MREQESMHTKDIAVKLNLMNNLVRNWLRLSWERSDNMHCLLTKMNSINRFTFGKQRSGVVALVLLSSDSRL